MQRVLVLLPVSLLLAACGGYGGGSSQTSQGSAAGGAVGKTIQISEREYSLTPGTITVSKPGTYAFVVTNHGTITHALTIEPRGGGGDEVESGDIAPGSSKTMEVTLAAGKPYEMYCPVDGHKAQGMVGTISIGASSPGETTTSSMPGY